MVTQKSRKDINLTQSVQIPQIINILRNLGFKGKQPILTYSPKRMPFQVKHI